MPCSLGTCVFVSLLLALSSFLTNAASSSKAQVTYPLPTNDVDRGISYPVELLKLALQRTAPELEVRPSSLVVSQARAIKLLQQGQVFDVLWTVTSREREQQLRAVPIPIDRGLYGWRLMLIRADQQARFDQILAWSDLQKMLAGQGHDWPDLMILRDSGLRVHPASYEGLFEMLAKGRIDFYPRALPEVWPELQQRANLHLALEAKLLVTYPSAMFFFVNPENQVLARHLQRGLELALQDGSFDRLFQAQYGEAIRRANLSQRLVFNITNRLQPNLKQGVDERWWLDTELASQLVRPATGQADTNSNSRRNP